jgi:hypothetical protein
MATDDITAVLQQFALSDLLYDQTVTTVRSTASVDQTLRVRVKRDGCPGRGGVRQGREGVIESFDFMLSSSLAARVILTVALHV